MPKNILLILITLVIAGCATGTNTTHYSRPPFVYKQIKFEHPADAINKYSHALHNYKNQPVYNAMSENERQAVDHYFMSLSFCQSGSWDAEDFVKEDNQRCDSIMSIYRELYTWRYTWTNASNDPVFTRLLDVEWQCNKYLKLAASLYPDGRIQIFCNSSGGVYSR